jgi:hypothetical protein
MMPMIDETTLATLVTKQAITEQLVKYCRAMDRCDHALGCAVFHTDAEADYGEMFKGSGHGFVEFALRSHMSMLTHSHHISNVLIEVKTAASETCVTMMCRVASADGARRDFRSIGRYVDQWETRDGEWRIARRRYVHGFDDSWPVTQASFPTDGRRDGDDISYRVFNALRAI